LRAARAPFGAVTRMGKWTASRSSGSGFGLRTRASTASGRSPELTPSATPRSGVARPVRAARRPCGRGRPTAPAHPARIGPLQGALPAARRSRTQLRSRQGGVGADPAARASHRTRAAAHGLDVARPSRFGTPHGTSPHRSVGRLANLARPSRQQRGYRHARNPESARPTAQRRPERPAWAHADSWQPPT
jgi:hypothetical protein